MTSKLISIVIVSWNTKDLTLSCLESISRGVFDDWCNVETIVVDNGSVDGTASAIRAAYPDVVVVENAENIGFGRANNLAIQIARGDILFFLNSDATISSDLPVKLLKEFDKDKSLGVLGCQLVDAGGRVQKSVRGHPTFSAVLYGDTPLRLIPFLKPAYERYRQKNFDFSSAKNVDTVMGAAMAIPKHILDEVGGFDPVFFMYFEEADLCRRIGEAGYKVKYMPDAKVIHVGGASSSQTRSRMFVVYRQSMFSYFRKYEGRLMTTIFLLLYKPLFIIDTFYKALVEGVKFAYAAFRLHDRNRGNKYREQFLIKWNFLTKELLGFILG